MTEFTGISDLYKKVEIEVLGLNYYVNIDKYTYAPALVRVESSQSQNGEDQIYQFVLRWKSKTDKEYISCNNCVGTGDIIFELSPIIPNGYKGIDFAINAVTESIINKQQFIDFIIQRQNKNIPFETYNSFSVRLNKILYPEILLRISFSQEVTQKIFDEIFRIINDFIQEYNNNMAAIHDFDIIYYDKTTLSLHIDLGNAAPEAICSLLNHLDKHYKNRISQIEIS